MKKFLLLVAVSLATVSFYSFGGLEVLYPSGAPAGYTGSPHDNKNCTYCHGGTATHMDSLISSTVPETGYVPGETYEITATISGSGKKGFEISPQNFGGTILGQLHAGSGTKLTGSGGYITHSTPKTSNPAVWHFTWTAPEENSGDVVLYGAFAIRKSQVKLSTLTLHEDITAGLSKQKTADFSVYPNPVIQREVNVSFNLQDAGETDIYLYNLKGNRKVLLSSTTENAGAKVMHLTIPGDFPAGLAILEVKTGSFVKRKKILIK